MIPDVLFDSVITLYGSDRTIKIINMGAGHTPSDVVVYLPEEKILFAGDLLFNRRHPNLGRNPDEWKRALEEMNAWDIDIAVSGHGSLCSKDKLMVLHNYITHLQTYVNEQAEKGKTKEEIINSSIPAVYNNWHFQRFYQVNLDHVCHTTGKF